ncbi:TonB-dependent receptor plug domain-containing protein [Roseateles saccharophilus]|nr:TonB-dependent receptor [Roseateles saccharophilus]
MSGLGALLAAPAGAAENDDKSKLDTVVVTGSAVPMTTKDAAAVSVTEMNRETIEKAGVSTDVLEVLRKGVPTLQGRGNAGASNANNLNQRTGGGSQLQLRNLDTLVLVNGRRVAISGIAAVGGKAFVNSSQIPPSAIERIEVLSDGSSAIYGSDAIGGVVNIILKSDAKGFDGGVRYGSADNYNEYGAYMTYGARLDGARFTASVNASHTDPLYQNERSFSTPITGRVSIVPGSIGGASPALLASGQVSPSKNNPTGAAATAPSLAALITNGTYLASSTAANAATYDLSQFQTLMQQQDQVAISLNAVADLIGRKLSAFGDLQLSDNRSSTRMLPVATTLTVPKGAAYDPITASFAGVNFADWDRPLEHHYDQGAARVTAGLRGKLDNGFGWEAAIVHSQNDLKWAMANVLFKPNIPLAVLGGYDANGNAVAGGKFSRVYANYSTSGALSLQPALDPFARAAGLDPASLANLYGTERVDMSSRLDSFDASLNGTLGSLPGGKPGFAIGVSTRREALAAHTDDNAHNTGPGAQSWLGGQFYDAFSKSRRIDAVFAEVRVPITGESWKLPGFSALDLIAAARSEKYSDAGSSVSPKLGLRWQPVDQSLTVRASVSKSFTAPTLYAEYGPTATRLVGNGVILSTFGLNNPGLQGMDGNNPNLQPSKADTKSLNLTFRPDAVPGLSLSAEYSNVSQKGYPGGIGFANILQSVNALGSASPFAANVAKGAFPGQPSATPFANPGDLLAYLQADPNNSLNVYAIDQFRNLGGVKLKAFTLNAEYEWETAAAGTFTLGTTGTIFDSYKFQALPSQKFYEYAGTVTNGGTGVQGTLPKYRFYTTLDWRQGPWLATLGNTYVSSVTDLGPGGIVYETSKTLKPLPVSAYMSWDLRLAYSGGRAGFLGVKSYTLALGVNNIGNRMPPLAPQAYTDNNADISSYSPLGRMVYVTAQAKF